MNRSTLNTLKNNQYLLLTSLGLSLAISAAPAWSIPITTDIVAVVDESGSMGSEHAWIDDAVLALQTNLAAAAGSDPLSAEYGLVGYTSGGPNSIMVGGGQFGSANEFATATSELRLTGAQEDGYEAMQYVFDNYNLNPSAATNIVLITDEDRDVADATTNYSSILASLTTENALLNAVVNCGFQDAMGNSAVGVDSKGNAYVADGAGGFTTSTGGVQSGSCFGSTKEDYVDLAFETGGAAWDLNFLRSGGLLADTFTNAFVDIKVDEIVEQQPVVEDPASPVYPTDPTMVSEPGTLMLLLAGFVGLILGRHKRV